MADAKTPFGESADAVVREAVESAIAQTESSAAALVRQVELLSSDEMSRNVRNALMTFEVTLGFLSQAATSLAHLNGEHDTGRRIVAMGRHVERAVAAKLEATRDA